MLIRNSGELLKKGMRRGVLETVDKRIHLLRLYSLKRIADAHVENKTALSGF